MRILHWWRCGLLAGFLVAPRFVCAQLVFELARKANSADSSGNHAEAARLWRRVFSVNGGGPGPLFAAAQSATRAGDRKAAFAALRQAIDEGFPVPIGALEADSALQALHNDSRWNALVAHARRLASGRDTALAAELVSLGERDQRNRDSVGAVVGRSGMGSPEPRRQTARLLRRMLLFRRGCGPSSARVDGQVVNWLATMPRTRPGSFCSIRILPTNERCFR